MDKGAKSGELQNKVTALSISIDAFRALSKAVFSKLNEVSEITVIGTLTRSIVSVDREIE